MGVEDSWRPDDLVTLPRLGSAHGSSLVLALDEVLSVLSEEGDRLITAFDLPHDFVEVMRAAGFPVDPVPLMESSSHDVVARTLAQADAVRPQLAGMTLKPYAVRPEYERVASALCLGYTSPSAESAVLVNSKSWSNHVVVEQGWKGAAWLVRSLEELKSRMSAERSTVLLKDPYGVSGQGTIAIRSETAYRSMARHFARQIALGKRMELLVQPLFEKRSDISSHWRISPDGVVRGVGYLVNDVDGFRYRGSAPLDPGDLPRKEFEHLESAGRTLCKELFEAGYFGPVSIDGLITADGTVVPCLEVNARVSMGTVALALMRHAARQHLHATLDFINVRMDGTAQRFSSFAQGLADAGLLYAAQRPGVLPITAGTFAHGQRGRLVLGVFHRPGAAMGKVRKALEVACASGIHSEDARYPCLHVTAGNSLRVS
ncbi:hypothetical protein ACFWIJ_01915 [Streptomyces sp. NPDC127079]|uniref:hypothetical protein n=1 Tax=Streptomyces sp. NPDC127079 TaxID=3347132 RepID=UPI003647DC1A